MARSIHVRGITFSSQIAVSGFIVMIALIELLGYALPEQARLNHLALVRLPIEYNVFQDILNVMWLTHLPITMIKQRPQWLTQIIVPTLVFQWLLLALIVQLSGWFDATMKMNLWVFAGLMSLVWFRVILGDKVE